MKSTTYGHYVRHVTESKQSYRDNSHMLKFEIWTSLKRSKFTLSPNGRNSRFWTHQKIWTKKKYAGYLKLMDTNPTILIVAHLKFNLSLNHYISAPAGSVLLMQRNDWKKISDFSPAEINRFLECILDYCLQCEELIEGEIVICTKCGRSTCIKCLGSIMEPYICCRCFNAAGRK